MEEKRPNTPRKFILRMIFGMLCGSAFVVGILFQTQNLIAAAIFFTTLVVGSAFVTWRDGKLGFVTGLIVGPITLCLGIALLLWITCGGGRPIRSNLEFRYFLDRLLYVNLEVDEIDSYSFDRQYGSGPFAYVIESLRATDSVRRTLPGSAC